MEKHSGWGFGVGNSLWVVVLLLVCACQQPNVSSPVEPAIRLAVDTASAPLAENLLNAYEGERAGGTIMTLTQLERQPALSALRSGEVDALILLHPLEQSDLFSTPIANEMLVIVANTALPVDSLSLDEIRDIFAGRTALWDLPGGPAIPIQAITRERGTSTRQAFETLVMEGQPITSSARLAMDEQNMVELVNSTPGGIGYVAGTSLPSLGEQAAPLSVEGVRASLEAARQRAYRLITPVVFVAVSEPQGALRNLLDWILSPEGQATVRQHALGVND
jgi:phosphate transport system substrate-binding protein